MRSLSSMSVVTFVLVSLNLSVAASAVYRKSTPGSLNKLLRRDDPQADDSTKDIPDQCKSQCPDTVMNFLFDKCDTDTHCNCTPTDISNMQACFTCVATNDPDSKQELDDAAKQAQQICSNPPAADAGNNNPAPNGDAGANSNANPSPDPNANQNPPSQDPNANQNPPSSDPNANANPNPNPSPNTNPSPPSPNTNANASSNAKPNANTSPSPNASPNTNTKPNANANANSNPAAPGASLAKASDGKKKSGAMDLGANRDMVVLSLIAVGSMVVALLG